MPAICAIEVPLHYNPADPSLDKELDTLVIKVVDTAYVCYEDDKYSGWRILSLTELPTFYPIVAEDDNSGAVEDYMTVGNLNLRADVEIPDEFETASL